MKFLRRLLNRLKAEALFLKDNLEIWYEDAKQESPGEELKRFEESRAAWHKFSFNPTERRRTE